MHSEHIKKIIQTDLWWVIIRREVGVNVIRKNLISYSSTSAVLGLIASTVFLSDV